MAILTLLSDDAAWRLAVRAAADLARRRFAPEASFEPMAALLEGVLLRRST